MEALHSERKGTGGKGYQAVIEMPACCKLWAEFVTPKHLKPISDLRKEGWMSSSEFADWAGRGRSQAQGMLLDGVRNGVIERQDAYGETTNGKRCVVPVYRPKPESA